MELHGLPDSVIDMTAIPSGAEPPPPCGSLRESMPVTETPRRTVLSGPKPGPRNGPTLQHLPLLHADVPARAGGGNNYAYRPNPSIWIDQLCLKCSFLPEIRSNFMLQLKINGITAWQKEICVNFKAS